MAVASASRPKTLYTTAAIGDRAYNSFILFFSFQLADVYGKVFSLRVGSDKMIIVSGYKMVKEALITQIDSFVDRPNLPLFHKIFKGLGKYTSHDVFA